MRRKKNENNKDRAENAFLCSSVNGLDDVDELLLVVERPVDCG